jgi:hypothetical protein
MPSRSMVAWTPKRPAGPRAPLRIRDQQPGDVLEPTGLILAQRARRDRAGALPYRPGAGDGVADAGLPGHRGNLDQRAARRWVGE